MPESGIVIGKLRETDQRYHELEELLSKPETFTDIPLYTETMKEYRSLTPVITKYREYIGVEREADEAAELARTSPDPEMRALAANELPPLRERQADMQELSNYFVTLLSAGYGKNIFSVSAETVERFKANYWPGNLRQLRNIIERSLLKAEDGRELEISDVCDDFGGEQTAVKSQEQGRTLDMRDAETNRILDALLKHNGNKAKTARYLGMSRGTLYNRLRELEANGIVL